MSNFDLSAATHELRRLATHMSDEEEVTLAQSVADYLDSTADDVPDVAYQEIAMAYIEGYSHATGEHPRNIWTALRASGLSR